MTTEVTPEESAQAALILEENINDRIFKALESDPYRFQQLVLNMLQQNAFDYRLREVLRNAIGQHDHGYSFPISSSTTSMTWK